MSLTTLSKTPSPLQLRDELEAMVLKELLGPGSEDEEIIESPGTKYFVGVLAPRKRAKAHIDAAPVPAVPHAEDDEDESAGEILDGDELALGGRDTSQDGTTDQAPAQDKALIPSSIGMTFSVNPEATELQLSAHWGQYVKEVSEYLVSEKTGSPRRVWKRYPRGGTHRLPLKDGQILAMPVDHNCPEVVIQGLCRKRNDHWCITLFLVNEQQEPLRLKDTAWVFQPELTAEGVDGAAVIHKRHTILELSGTDPAVKAENDLLAMLYRRHGKVAVLAVIVVLTGLLTELLSNNACAALMGVLALATAKQLGMDPRPLLIAVAVTSSYGFATPIGYQTNLMVLGPGGYRFADYLRVGIPLDLICWAMTIIVIPLVWTL